MTDRELLEFAAKAAGIDVRWIAECQDYYEHRPHMLPGYWDKWNPLTDDGDALRLAVKLGISPLMYPACIGIKWPQNNLPSKLIGIDAPYEDISSEQDPYAATRRAIVRAAAEIGRNMP